MWYADSSARQARRLRPQRISSAIGLLGFEEDPAQKLLRLRSATGAVQRAQLAQGLSAYAAPVLFGLGAGAALPGLIVWTPDRSGPGERATATSPFYSVYEIGLFSGATVLGQLLERGGPAAFLVVAALLAGGLGLYACASVRGRAAARAAL